VRVVLEWATFIMATIAAVGSVVRAAPRTKKASEADGWCEGSLVTSLTSELLWPIVTVLPNDACL
jgi:hypothetical protein